MKNTTVLAFADENYNYERRITRGEARGSRDDLESEDEQTEESDNEQTEQSDDEQTEQSDDEQTEQSDDEQTEESDNEQENEEIIEKIIAVPCTKERVTIFVDEDCSNLPSVTNHLHSCKIVEWKCIGNDEQPEYGIRFSPPVPIQSYFSSFLRNEFLMARLIQIIPFASFHAFIRSTHFRGPSTLRVNTIKTTRYELAQNFVDRSVPFKKYFHYPYNSMTIYSRRFRKLLTPEFLSGHYVFQDVSAFYPVLALDPQENETILDICAGPGEKAAHIAAVMSNKGTLVANEISEFHAKRLSFNLKKLGVGNSIITNLDGRSFHKYFAEFDRVLVDVPSTGTAVVSRDPMYRVKIDSIEIERFAKMQRELLLAAIDCTNANSIKGAYIVYTTTSIFPEENECVVEYALNNRKVELVDMGLRDGVEGLTEYMGQSLHPDLILTRRFYPHLHNVDSCFVAKLMKYE